MSLAPALFLPGLLMPRIVQARVSRVGAVKLVPAISDEELCRRVGGGDRWAEDAFYRLHVEAVYTTVRRLLGNTNDAEDVVQDTFATAFEVWSQLREPARARQWLMQIAVRKVHRRFRRRRLLSSVGLDKTTDDATLESLAHSDASPETRAELAILDGVLKRLSAPRRIAWMLRYADGLELTEVAAECGCSLATVKRRIAAAHRVVRRHVQIVELPNG